MEIYAHKSSIVYHSIKWKSYRIIPVQHTYCVFFYLYRTFIGLSDIICILYIIQIRVGIRRWAVYIFMHLWPTSAYYTYKIHAGFHIIPGFAGKLKFSGIVNI